MALEVLAGRGAMTSAKTPTSKDGSGRMTS